MVITYNIYTLKIMNHKKKTQLAPVHPGKILLRGIKDYKLTVYRVAKDTGIPRSTLDAIVNERRPVSPENALRLARYFNTSPEYWINLQAGYDLRIAKLKKTQMVDREVKPLELVTT